MKYRCLSTLLVALVLLSFATGCERFVAILASGDVGKPLLSFSERTGFNGGYLSVYALDPTTDKEEEKWRIESIRATDYKFVEQIPYGETPEGFREVVKSRPLDIGHLYEIVGSNEGAVILAGRFYISKSHTLVGVVNVDPRLTGEALLRKIRQIDDEQINSTHTAQ